MWTRAADVYNRLAAARAGWRGQPVSGEPGEAVSDDDGGSEASFTTAIEGQAPSLSSRNGIARRSPPELRLQSPDGGTYSPSIPSTSDFGSARKGTLPLVLAAPPEAAGPAVNAQPASPATIGPSPSAPLPSNPRQTETPIANAPVGPAAAPQPNVASGLLERLKAQRTARFAQDPPASAATPAEVTRPLPAAGPASAISAIVASVSLPTDIPQSPPLQPFDTPRISSASLAYEPVAFDTTFPLEQLGQDHMPWTGYDDFNTTLHQDQPIFREGTADGLHPLPDMLDDLGPVYDDHRSPSAMSVGTVLNEAMPLESHQPTADWGVSPPAGGPIASGEQHSPMWERQNTSSAPSPLEQRRRLREAKLEWERRRREEERAQESPGVDVVAAPATLVASSSGTQLESLPPDWSDPAASSVSPLAPEPVLLEGWLLLPPVERPFTPGLLSFPDLWQAFYAVLTPSQLFLVSPPADVPTLAYSICEVARTVRLTQHNCDGFEPFCIELKNGDKLYFAGVQALDGALWSLKLDNARTGAFKRSSALVDIPDFPAASSASPSSSSSLVSSRIRSRRQPSSPPTSTSSPPPYGAHLARLDSLVSRYQRDLQMKSGDGASHVKNSDNAMRVGAVLHELPPGAGVDDWGLPEEYAHKPAPPPRAGSSPDPAPSQVWPARPPTEHYSPASTPSPSPAQRVDPQHALELQVILDRLALLSATVDDEVERVDSDEQQAREVAQELRMLSETVRARAEREGRQETEAEERVLDKIDWLEHVNNMRLRSPSDREELARLAQEERRLLDEAQAEINEAFAQAHKPSTTALNYRPQVDDAVRLPTCRITGVIADKRGVPGFALLVPRKFVGGDAPSAGSRHPHPQPQYDSELSFDSRDLLHNVQDPAERRRRLQNLFLDIELQLQNQRNQIAFSKEQQQHLTRTLGKVLSLVQHSSHLHTSQLSSLVRRLDSLVSQLNHPTRPPGARSHSSLSKSTFTSTSASTPPPPPPYQPTSPLVDRQSAARKPAPSRRPHASAPPLAQQSMHLVPGDGRMAARLLPRRLVAEGLAAAEAERVERKGKAKQPILGVSPALPKDAHVPRWADGAQAARRAREVEAILHPLPPGPAHLAATALSAPAKVRKASRSRALERELRQNERVNTALGELRGGTTHAPGPSAPLTRGTTVVLSEEDPVKKAIAVWEVLDEARRTRQALEVEEAKRSKGQAKTGRRW
ncbi:uncharacterized protein JCM10292_007736 [Rhodotorula paludigena]|uniref:uncharacterized protein n=1 Tax=Rhodotorula paludigena TaxID=86838 RepID=UPI0031790F46